MTNREIVLKMLNGEETHRMVFMPLCSRTYFRGLAEYSKLFEPDWNDRCVPIVKEEDEFKELEFKVNFMKNIGVTFKTWATEEAYILQRDPAAGVSKEIIRNGNEVQVLYKTPAGTVTQKLTISDNQSTMFAHGHLINTDEDFKIFRKFLEAPVKVLPAYEKAGKMLQIIGGDGIFTARMPCAPLKDWILNELGVEGVVFGIMERPDAIAELEGLLHRLNLDICEVISKSPYKVFNDASVFGTGMVSPEIIEEHYLPFTKEYSKIIRDNHKINWNHASGEPLSAVLDLFLESNVRVLSGITFPGPDYDLAEVCRNFEGKVTLVGGLSPHFLATAGIDDIKDTAKRILDITAPYSNFILGTADDVVYGTPIKNLEVVAKIANDFRK